MAQQSQASSTAAPHSLPLIAPEPPESIDIFELVAPEIMEDSEETEDEAPVLIKDRNVPTSCPVPVSAGNIKLLNRLFLPTLRSSPGSVSGARIRLPPTTPEHATINPKQLTANDRSNNEDCHSPLSSGSTNTDNGGYFITSEGPCRTSTKNDWHLDYEFHTAIEDWLHQQYLQSREQFCTPSPSPSPAPLFSPPTAVPQCVAPESVSPPPPASRTAARVSVALSRRTSQTHRRKSEPVLAPAPQKGHKRSSKTTDRSRSRSVSSAASTDSSREDCPEFPVFGTFKKKRSKYHPQYTEEEKPYVCDDCTKRFRRQEHLKRHIRSCHTDFRPYECKKCKKCFSRSDNLANHLRTHMGFRRTSS